MSVVYCSENKLVYTGGHDGSIFAWNFETGYSKYQLDVNDPTCTSKDYIRDSKSVDKLLILNEKSRLLSMTADQTIRFWELKDAKPPTFKFNCKHPEDDHLTAIAVTNDNNTLLTADTGGQMKMWDISEVNLNDQSTKNMFLERYFIIAHKAMINTVHIAEERVPEKFIVSASNDNNIHLHRLKNGVYIGYFG